MTAKWQRQRQRQLAAPGSSLHPLVFFFLVQKDGIVCILIDSLFCKQRSNIARRQKLWVGNNARQAQQAWTEGWSHHIGAGHTDGTFDCIPAQSRLPPDSFFYNCAYERVCCWVPSMWTWNGLCGTTPCGLGLFVELANEAETE